MLNQVCFNCFSKKQHDGSCPVCGFDNRTGSGRDQSYGVSLAPGTILTGRYLVGKTLGQGGFGITYLALDLQSGEKYAIKEFFPSHLVTRLDSGRKTHVQPNSSKDEDIFRYGLKKFKEEAELLASFRNQKHIVSIHRFFYENNTGYFVMEYIDGISLKDYVRRMNGRLIFADVVGIFEPVLKAVAFIHSKGLIHRDISPDNIYIRKDGTVKLLDFGAARFFTQSKGKAMTTILKPGFAPPEQYSSTGKQGPWSDIYAAAGSMYYALTGKTPLDALSRRLEDQLVRPTTVNASVSPAQETVLLKGLAIDASKRYASAAEFATALKRSLRPNVLRQTTANSAASIQTTAQHPNRAAEGPSAKESRRPIPSIQPQRVAPDPNRILPSGLEKNPLENSLVEVVPVQNPEAGVSDMSDPFPFDEDDFELDGQHAVDRAGAGKNEQGAINHSAEFPGGFSTVDYVLVGSLGAIILIVLIILINF